MVVDYVKVLIEYNLCKTSPMLYTFWPKLVLLGVEKRTRRGPAMGPCVEHMPLFHADLTGIPVPLSV